MLMVKKGLPVVLLLIVFSGCADSGFLQRLKTLKAVADEQEDQKVYVAEQDKKFEKLYADVKSGTDLSDKTAEEIIDSYGNPVFSRHVTEDGRRMTLWVYRYAAKYFNSDKVYVYFDDLDRVARIKLVEAEKDKKEESEK